MCLVKTPKVVQSTAAENKEAPVLRNPYLDGLPSILRARRGGVQSLTIRRGGPSGSANTPPPAPTPVAPPPTGGGSTSRDAELGEKLSRFPGTLGLVGKALIKKASQ